jgi:hypothetical protein
MKMDVKSDDPYKGQLEESEACKISVPGEDDKKSSAHSFQIRPEFEDR